MRGGQEFSKAGLDAASPKSWGREGGFLLVPFSCPCDFIKALGQATQAVVQWPFCFPPAPCCPVQLCPFPVHKAASMSHQFLRQQCAQAGYYWEAENSLPCTMPLCFAFSTPLL